MDQPGIEQRTLRMINGITREFGEVHPRRGTGPGGEHDRRPGEGWAVAMTVLTHEREPQELGNASRYTKTASSYRLVGADPAAFTGEQHRELAWASSRPTCPAPRQPPALGSPRRHRARPRGSIDKLLNTWVEQAVGHAAVDIAGCGHDGGDPAKLNTYLYSRAQSVMGGTAQIQKNLIASRISVCPRPDGQRVPCQ